MAESGISKQVKRFGFGLRAFKKFPEVIPLVSMVSVAVAGGLAFMAYSLYTKPDLQLRSGDLRFENVKPNETVKLVTINQQYREIPELEALRKEIGSYKS